MASSSPPRVRSKFLLSGLLRCGHCGRPYIGQGAKSGRFAHYVCNTLHREGAGACQARYLSAPRLEQFVVEKMKELILTDETITELVTLVSEEVAAMAGEFADRLQVIKAELADVQNRLGRLYDALETSRLALDALSPPYPQAEAPLYHALTLLLTITPGEGATAIPDRAIASYQLHVNHTCLWPAPSGCTTRHVSPTSSDLAQDPNICPGPGVRGSGHYDTAIWSKVALLFTVTALVLFSGDGRKSRRTDE